jgi:hypothetical protein
LAQGLPLGPQGHVHVLTPAAHDATLHVAAGDCLLLAVPGARYEDLPGGLAPAAPDEAGLTSFLDLPSAPGLTRAVWVTGELDRDSTLTAAAGGPELFRVSLRRTPGRVGCDRFWS